MATLAKCLGGMVRNVIGKASELEVLTKAVVGRGILPCLALPYLTLP